MFWAGGRKWGEVDVLSGRKEMGETPIHINTGEWAAQ